MSTLVQHIIGAVLAIIFAVVFYLNTLAMTFAGYLLPRILSGVIILLSVAMIIEAYICRQKHSKPADGKKKLDKRRVLIFIMLIVAYIGAISPLGYFTVTPLYIIGVYWYLKAMNLKKAAIIAGGFTVFVYLLFVLFLHLPIPLGPME